MKRELVVDTECRFRPINREESTNNSNVSSPQAPFSLSSRTHRSNSVASASSAGKPPRSSPTAGFFTPSDNKVTHRNNYSTRVSVLKDPVKLTKPSSSPPQFCLSYQKKEPSWKRIANRISSPISAASASSEKKGDNGAISDSNSFYSLSDTSTDHELDALMDEGIDEIMNKDSVAKSLIFRQPTPTIKNGNSIPTNSSTSEAISSDTTTNVRTWVSRDGLSSSPLASFFNSYHQSNNNNAYTPTVKVRHDGSDEECGENSTVKLISPKQFKDKISTKELKDDNSVIDLQQNNMSLNQTQSFESMVSSVHSFLNVPNTISIVYLCVFAILGSILRVYIGRIFGYDCEFRDETSVQNHDFLHSLSLCVTASGTTQQRGGALFIDLPANMFGSFFMGLLTPIEKEYTSIPWLKSTHRLQNNVGIQLSLRTAFCGSLTTFSSWNTQMVVMMTGYGLPLGKQIVPALFGYILGLSTSISSFVFGQRVNKYLYKYRHADSQLSGKEEGQENDTTTGAFQIQMNRTCSSTSNSTDFGRKSMSRNSSEDNSGVQWLKPQQLIHHVDCIVHGKYSPIIFLALIFSLLLIADLKLNIKSHKKIWVSSLFAPFGTLLRLKFSSFNSKWLTTTNKLNAIPKGTLIANITSCVISVVAQALLMKLDNKSELLLSGIKVGFAGNLSTVSTLVKEVVHLDTAHNEMGWSYYYAWGTIGVSMVISLCTFLLVILLL